MLGKTALITGCSSGIGKALATALLQENYQVFATVRTTDDGESLVQETNGKIIPLILDLTDPPSIFAALRQLEVEYQVFGISVLINNAGIATAGPLEYLDIDRIKHQLEVNVLGTLSLTQQALPFLRRGQGRIINIGSVSGQITLPFFGPYSASKSALAALTRALRMELKPWGIPVTLIQPGNIQTPIWDKSIRVTEEIMAGFSSTATEYYEPYLNNTLTMAGQMS
ncbi:MAG: SDR family oxidoreductase, partial [Chloroflexota bacterium]